MLVLVRVQVGQQFLKDDMNIHEYLESFGFLLKLFSMSVEGFVTNMMIFAQVFIQSFMS